jgi:hypothetical protein
MYSSKCTRAAGLRAECNLRPKWFDHDWTGASLIPGTTVDEVLAVASSP